MALRASGVHAPAPAEPGAWPYATAGVQANGHGTHGTPAPMSLTAIPYALWGNRTPGPMRVWIPLAG